MWKKEEEVVVVVDSQDPDQDPDSPENLQFAGQNHHHYRILGLNTARTGNKLEYLYILIMIAA